MSKAGSARWAAATGVAMIATCVAFAWYIVRRTAVGPFDPLAAVIGLAGLAVAIAILRLAHLAQMQADQDVRSVTQRLAVMVSSSESRERRQLLGGDVSTIDVRFRLMPAAAHMAAGASRAGSLSEVVAYYRRLRPQRMVITGAAGAGKTVLALELMLGLLEGRADDEPVPIRLSASTLDTSIPVESAVRDWLVMHVTEAYGVSRRAAAAMVKAGMVLPVIDGLDEMDHDESIYPSRAAQAIQAFNAFIDGRQKGAMILTCRNEVYEALEGAQEWLKDAAHVRLLPVSTSAARAFFRDRVADRDRWRPVLDAMHSHVVLASALATPWRLTLAATVYEARDEAHRYIRDPAELADPDLTTEDEIRDQLFGLLVPATLATHGYQYPEPMVIRWLGVLAAYLEGNSGREGQSPRAVGGRPLSSSDIVLYELWPLAGSRAARFVTAGMAAIPWLLIFMLLITEAGAFLSWVVWVLIGLAIALRRAWKAWPDAAFLSFRHLRLRRGRYEFVHRFARRFLVGMPYGIGAGVYVGFMSFVAAGFGGAGLGEAITFGIGATLFSVLMVGTGYSLISGLRVAVGEYAVATPRELISNTLVTNGLMVPVAGFIPFLSASGSGVVRAFFIGVASGLWFMLALGPFVGLLGWRYVALLICTRRWNKNWLPWRLGRFLDWSYDAGLLRLAGIAYQFRHRELQDYLARQLAADDVLRSRDLVPG